MNLVVHNAYGVWFLRSVDVSGDKKEGQFIFELIDKCIEEIGENNVVQVVTDTARPNVTVGRLLNVKHTHIFLDGMCSSYDRSHA